MAVTAPPRSPLQRIADPPSPTTFLRQLYSAYNDAPGQRPPDVLGRSAPSIFDPELLALIRKDRAMAHGDLGLIISDPICDCQDWDHLEVLSVDVVPSGPDQVHATLNFTNGGQKQLVEYELVTVGGQWRVHDVSNSLGPSLRRYLSESLARKRARVSNH